MFPLAESSPTRQLLVGKQRFAPPARMLLLESFCATLAASCCPEWRHHPALGGGISLHRVPALNVFGAQMEIRPKGNVATRLLA
jgi:hypothetical protein